MMPVRMIVMTANLKAETSEHRRHYCCEETNAAGTNRSRGRNVALPLGATLDIGHCKLHENAHGTKVGILGITVIGIRMLVSAKMV
jgi:hypothetical protein